MLEYQRVNKTDGAVNADDFCSYGSRSEEPNNCETCRFELYCPEMCEGCCEWDSHYEPKTESTISKMEQVGTTEDCSMVDAIRQAKAYIERLAMWSKTYEAMHMDTERKEQTERSSE